MTRTPCLVPFCRRTTKLSCEPVVYTPDGDHAAEEWICGPHWRAVPSGLKAKRAAAKRRNRKRRDWRSVALCAWLWSRCKRAAIEAAGGLA